MSTRPWIPFNNELPPQLRFNLPIDFCTTCNKPTFFGFYQAKPSIREETGLAALDIPSDDPPELKILCERCMKKQTRAPRKS